VRMTLPFSSNVLGKGVTEDAAGLRLVHSYYLYSCTHGLCMRFAVKLELSDQCSTDLATCLSQWAETAALGGRCGGGAVEAGDLGRALAGGL
jgi:hypothetical protein